MAPIARYTPQLQRADLVDVALEGHRHHVVVLARELQRHFERPQLFQLVAPVVYERSWRIALANGGTEKPEFRRLADNQPELTVRNRGRRPFLHPERNHAERLQRRR